MSLLSWFSRKSLPKRASEPDTSGFSVPAGDRASTTGRASAPDSRPDQAKILKNERMERREWLYSVVREAMLHAGVLTASFKFKVLALDERGRQFLVMIDLAPQLGGDTGRLSKIESQIIGTAKARYDLIITAVYWRTNEHVAVGLSRNTTAAPVFAAETPKVSAAAPLAPAPEPALGAPAKPSSGRFEPIQADEVAAFKRALAAAGQTAAAPPGQVVRSGPRSKSSESGYEDTEMQHPDHRPDALSATQYGDLR
ncbi:MAG: hypothetical protein JWP29_936 [Rhodoferax sp.]|nr:hypothetical protein [Rhodoferax sp.]